MAMASGRAASGAAASAGAGVFTLGEGCATGATRAGAPGRYSSTSACTFVPPRPKPETPARRGAPSGAVQRSARVTTSTGPAVKSMAGFGRSTSMDGGSRPSRTDSTAFSSAGAPAAPSRWPMLDFTEPMRSGRARPRP
ncbi:hypothetical protein PSR1_04439 [Anaeromyxobacter sp. PSR-1]|nr:hypothetical protein PSR1_04439 [Anaeromyxobacter sp. PSR-1]